MSKQSDDLDIKHYAFLIVAAFVTLYFIWIMLGHYVVNTGIIIATALIKGANVLYNFIPQSELTNWVFFLFVHEDFIKNKDEMIDFMISFSSAQPSLSDAKSVFYVIGYFLRLPIVAFGVWGSYLCYKQSRPSQLNRTFNIFKLAQYTQTYFPQIKPAISANLLSKSFDEGPYRQEVSPVRFAILNQALSYISEDGQEYKVKFGKKLTFNEKTNVMTILDSYDVDSGLPVLHRRARLDTVKVRKCFVNQITRHGRWEGHQSLSPQLKALYAVFLLMIKGGKDNKEKAFDMLDRFSATFQSSKKLKAENMFDDSGVAEVIKQFEDQVAVKKIQAKHTFAITVLMALYERATHRRSKLPPSRFLWLKEADISAWYALCQNLSPGAWTEGAGPRGIFLTEKKIAGKAHFPFTDNALIGYLNYLNSEGWLIEQPEGMHEVAIS